MSYDPMLPEPLPTDLTECNPDDLPSWSCSYCGFTEQGPLTIRAEAQRCLAHESRCSERPEDDLPTVYQRAAWQIVHATSLRRDLDLVMTSIEDKEYLLGRTWVLEFRIRRSLRAEIKEARERIHEIFSYASTLGLEEGWSNDGFYPCVMPR